MSERPERRADEPAGPPAAPSPDRRGRHAQRIELTHRRSRARAGTQGADYDHDRSNIDAPAKEAHGEWRSAMAAVSTAEAVAEIATGTCLTRKPARLTRIASATTLDLASKPRRAGKSLF